MAPFLRSSRRLPSFLLDIDGTLVFTDHLYRKVFEKLLSPLGYDVTDEFYAANVHGKVDADVFGKLLPADTSEDELKAWSKLKDSTFVELYNEQTRADGKPPMLNGLPEALQRAQAVPQRRDVTERAAPTENAFDCLELRALREALKPRDVLEVW